MRDRQKVFIKEYLVDFNATQAAIRSGYSKKTAYSIGQENLKKPEIKAEIDAAKQARFIAIQMSADEALARLADMARGDLGEFMEVSTMGWNVELLQRNEKGELILDENNRPIKKTNTKLLKRIKQKVTTILAKTEDGEDKEIIETEIELHDPQAALDKILRAHGRYKDTVTLDGTINIGNLQKALDKAYGTDNPAE